MSDAQVKRAGLDYHEMANVTVHPNLVTAWTTLKPERVFAFTAHAERYHTDVDYRPGDVLLFGPPNRPDCPRRSSPNPRSPTRVRIPMLAGRRSHNLANAASIVVYEAWRQNGFAGAV